LSPAESDSDNHDGSILGPILIAKVQMEDKTVEALLDTGITGHHPLIEFHCE